MNKEHIEISIVMGVYNQKDHKAIEQAVDSIINQTIQNLEFLIYDDGSCKEEMIFLQELAKKDSRLRLIRGEVNKGLAYGLNQCLKQAKGTYIARMDADDISAKERLQKQKQFLDVNTKYAFVGTSAKLFDEKGVWGVRLMPKHPTKRDFLKYSPYIHPSVMFRKSALEQVNGYQVSKDTLRCEDYDLFMRLYCKGLYGCNIEELLFYYRECRDWYDKRTIRQRIAEMKIRYRGFHAMGILHWNTFIYVVKPIGMIIIPKMIRNGIRKMKNVKNVYSSGIIRRTRSRSGRDVAPLSSKRPC